VLFSFPCSDFWHALRVKVKRPVWILLLGCILLAASVALLWPRGPKEPEYQGKRLSEWMWLFNPRDPIATAKATEAMQHFGTNAIPFLLEWFRYDEGPWQKRLRPIIPKLPGKIGNRVYRIVFRNEIRSAFASKTLSVMGPPASGAVPPLTRMICEGPGSQNQLRAFVLLVTLHEKDRIDISSAVLACS
jgi:hypothetical protein